MDFSQVSHTLNCKCQQKTNSGFYCYVCGNWNILMDFEYSSRTLSAKNTEIYPEEKNIECVSNNDILSQLLSENIYGWKIKVRISNLYLAHKRKLALINNTMQIKQTDSLVFYHPIWSPLVIVFTKAIQSALHSEHRDCFSGQTGSLFLY